MEKFEVGGDGLVYEAPVRAAVERLAELFPGVDAPSLEAHLMLERGHRLLQSLRDSHWSGFGLTGSRFILLRMLYTSDERRLSMGEIAAQMNSGLNNVTQLVDGLARDGLVERRSADGDKRVVHAVLTGRGEELFAAVFPQTSARIQQAWAPLSADEKLSLVDLLSRLRCHLLTAEAAREWDSSMRTPPAGRLQEEQKSSRAD